MIRRYYHHLLLVAAFCALLATLVSFGREKRSRPRVAVGDRSDDTSEAVADVPNFSRRTVGAWRAAEFQEGERWPFELFTPPAMHRDPATNRFVLNNSNARNPVQYADESFKTAEFGADADRGAASAERFQMLGYVQRSAAEIVGIFQNLETSEVCVSAAGALPATWNAVVETVQLDSTQLGGDDTATVILPRARAIVRDRVTGVRYALSTDEHREEPEPRTAEIGATEEIVLADAATSDRNP